MTRRFMWCVACGFLSTCLSCGGSDEAEGYGAEHRDEFVQDCTNAGTDEPVCACLYDALEAQVPFERFEELDEQLRSGIEADVPDDIQAMAVSCAVQDEEP